jgi:hypothetical protein
MSTGDLVGPKISVILRNACVKVHAAAWTQRSIWNA